MKERCEVKAAARIILICLALMLVVSVQTGSGREVAGVLLPESVVSEGKALVLNGAGIRKKFSFIKVYVGALYLSVKRTSVAEILADPGAKRIAMSFLRDIELEKIVKAWNEGFVKNSSPEEMKSLQERINQFNSMFTTVRKGDVIQLDYIPEKGTQVRINKELKGTVSGEDFSRALLKIWLGDKPADVNLKEEMLGNAY